MKDIDWRQIVNGLTGPFPEVGSGPSEIESQDRQRLELDDMGEFHKLSMVIYFFTDNETGKTFTTQRHWLTEFGEVSLREALSAIKRKRQLDKES